LGVETPEFRIPLPKEREEFFCESIVMLTIPNNPRLVLSNLPVMFTAQVDEVANHLAVRQLHP
jgi:hypothetical protein